MELAEAMSAPLPSDERAGDVSMAFPPVGIVSEDEEPAVEASASGGFAPAWDGWAEAIAKGKGKRGKRSEPSRSRDREVNVPSLAAPAPAPWPMPHHVPQNRFVSCCFEWKVIA